MRIFTYSLLAGILLALPALPVAAQTLERIKQTGELKLGFRTDASPLSYVDENGQPAGYSPLLCTGIAQAIANQLKMSDLLATFHAVDAYATTPVRPRNNRSPLLRILGCISDHNLRRIKRRKCTSYRPC